MKTTFFTGNGDNGSSSFGNKKIKKGNVLFEFLGNFDELNSWIGFCRVGALQTFKNDAKGILVLDSLKNLQEDLFIAQAEIASIGFSYEIKKINRITELKTARLEKTIWEIDSLLPTIRNFILAGGSELSARLDIARAIARRVERSAVIFEKHAEISKDFLQFLNRLSSLLFALARYTNYLLGIQEEHPQYK